MNIKQIKDLIALMNENNLTEIEIEEEGVKIKLSKRAQGAVEEVIVPVSAEGKKQAVEEAAVGAPEEKQNVKEVKSPMVGTFYAAPAPDADPYVKVGDVIQKGDVLCIVEAMKLMNEVKAEFGGKVVEISVQNAEAVEFGQTLFLMVPL